MTTPESRCRSCGTEIDAGASFCAACGLNLTVPIDADATVAMTASGAPTPARSTMRQMLREATEGEYEILEELGRGGMATVFLAHHLALDRRVAIKVMAPNLLEGEGMADRFKLEARTAAKLSHPHIIPIYAVKETATSLYFVMKYVEGRALDSIIEKMGPMPVATVRDILVKVGGALGYAHRHDVVHRDVKPANIMIDEEGTPIVTDFGIAKVATATGLTVTGTTIGTPSYMSPEQCEAKPVTGASDQYALGIVAFQMLTGRLPFAGDTPVTVMYKHCHDELPPLADFRPDCPPEVAETIERMVAKDPGDRWPSLEAAIRRLGIGAEGEATSPLHDALVKAAREGDLDRLAELSTPKNAVPGVDGTPVTGGPAGVRKRSRFAVFAMMGLAVVAVGVLALAQPWAAAGPDAGETERPPSTLLDGGVDGAPGVGGGVDGGPGDATGEVTGDPVLDVTRLDDQPADAPATNASDPPPAATTSGQLPPVSGGDDPVDLPLPVRSVLVSGLPDRIEVGDVAELTGLPVDGNGRRVATASVRWSSDHEAVIRVTSDGSITAVGAGTAVVMATSQGVSGTVVVTVAAESVARVEVAPSDVAMVPGETTTLSATPRGRSGDALPGRTLGWSVSDPAVATITPGGEVTAIGPGATTATVTVDGVVGSATITVSAAPVDTRTAITDLVDAYARAIETRDIEQVHRAYPGLTTEQAGPLASALEAMRDLTVTLTIESFESDGDSAAAQVSGTYAFVDGPTGQRQQIPVSLTALFERDSTGWRMVETR